MKTLPKNYCLASACGQEIANVRELGAADFEQYAADITALEAFDQEERLFRLVELNHRDLLDRVAAYGQAYAADPRMDMNRLTEIHLDLNRLVLNLLSSVRTYLDHTETRLKRMAPSESAAFKTLTAEAFDQHFAYRFLSKLRNYAQHCGLPAGSVTVQSEKKRRTLSLKLVSAALLENFDGWGAVVKADLRGCPEEFDILPLLAEKVRLLALINNQMSALLLDKITPAGERLLALLREALEKKPGRPLILSMRGTKNRSKMQLRWLPLAMISRTTGIEIVFE
ncbi:MAG: hypothetical protein JWR54_1053 [Mucilaginibacter sp.]|nr:hypothetical protein [Mucilaginibacter sp.]